MKKKILIGLLTAATAFAALGLAACGDDGNGGGGGGNNNGADTSDFEFGQVEAGWAVTGYTGTSENVTIPSTYNGNKIVAIHLWAFEDNTTVKNVTLPEGIILIDESAFDGCTNLETVTFPDSLQTINTNAFYGCTSLKSVEFGDSLHSIGTQAFKGCTDLASVEFGDNLTSIGEWAFGECDSLTSVELPDGITTIAADAFAYCVGLTSVELPTTLERICEYAFSGTSLNSVTIPASVTAIDQYAFSNCYTLVEVVNLSSLTMTAGTSQNGEVAAHAKQVITNAADSKLENEGGCVFYVDENECVLVGYAGTATTLVLPETYNGVAYEVQEYAMRGNAVITDLTFPASMTSMSKMAFTKMRYLESIAVAEGNTVYESAGNCLIESASDTLVLGCQNSVIPDDGSVTVIGEYAFAACDGLTDIVIPSSVTAIERYAFEDCDGLTELVIGNSVETIGNTAFNGCGSVTTVIIPQSVTEIGNNVFGNCHALAEVYYCANEEFWADVQIGGGNGKLTNAAIYYFSETNVENGWHYVDGEITKW